MDRCEPDAKEVKINQVYCKTAAPGAKKKLNHDVQAQAGIALMVLLLWNVFIILLHYTIELCLYLGSEK